MYLNVYILFRVMERGETEDVVKFTEDRLLLGLGANEKKQTHIWDFFF